MYVESETEMSEPPDWLSTLADGVAAEIQGLDLLAPLGCHYYYDKDAERWEIALFASRTEIVGGERDGLLTSSRFSLDLIRVASLLHEVSNIIWQALPIAADDELGAHVLIEGVHGGERVAVRVLAEPPERFESGRIAKTYQHGFEDAW